MKSVDQWGDDLESKPVFTIAKVAIFGTILVLAIIALVGVATTGSVFFQAGAAKVTNGARIQSATYDVNNSVAAITKYHTQCTGVQRQLQIWKVNTQRAVALQAATKSATDPLVQQQNQQVIVNAISDAAAALDAAYSAEADYNQTAANRLTKPFKDAGLPDRISIPTNKADLDVYSVECG